MTRSTVLPNRLVPSGLVIAVCSNKHILEDVRLILTEQALGADNALGLQFIKYKKVISVYAGPQHQRSPMLAHHLFIHARPNGTKHELIRVASCPNQDFCDKEVFTAIEPIIFSTTQEEHPSMFVLCQGIGVTENPVLGNTLQKYRRELIASGSTGIVILGNSHGFDRRSLPRLCEMFIEVAEVEPDFDMDFSVTFNPQNLVADYGPGSRKVMCSTRYVDQDIIHSYTPFISSCTRERAMWSMRCAGFSYSKLSEIFGINKSNVVRQLKKLPSTSGYRIDEQRFQKMLRFFDFGEAAARTNLSSNFGDLSQGGETAGDLDIP